MTWPSVEQASVLAVGSGELPPQARQRRVRTIPSFLVSDRLPDVYPTLPSRLTPSSFCASTANSMGSSLKTSLQKPFTIMLTASSGEIPRDWK